MEKTEKLLKIAAASNIPVLLQGESGAGKEVAARRLHQGSARHSKPFIAINCGAIPTGLIESTLEGSQKGAFTGANATQLGVVRAAEGGTLFLDEIGEMPLEMQKRLLRILQERSVLPVGATESIHVDFRLICATNRDLKTEVALGRFREDLFFRLNTFPITIPPLRKRYDFEEIAISIWEEIQSGEWQTNTASGQAHRGQSSPLTYEELQTLKNKPWPGNIRQLKNVLQRYALLKPFGYTLASILDEEFEPTPTDMLKETTTRYQARSHAPDIEIIENAITKFNGNKTQAAHSLGISRGCLCYQIKKACPKTRGHAELQS